MEMLEDTLEEGNVDVGIRKTDTVTVNLTSKMSTDVGVSQIQFTLIHPVG
jgi:hypothetical protein